MPALLMTTVTSPSSAAAAATDAGSVTSRRTAVAPGVVTDSGSRAPAYTVAPASTRASVNALPRPRLAPVTRTVDWSMEMLMVEPLVMTDRSVRYRRAATGRPDSFPRRILNGPIGPYDRSMPRAADPATRDRILDAAGQALLHARHPRGRHGRDRDRGRLRQERALPALPEQGRPGPGLSPALRPTSSTPSMDAALDGLRQDPERGALVAVTREVADRVTAPGFARLPVPQLPA